jgi:hypothetical protein
MMMAARSLNDTWKAGLLLLTLALLATATDAATPTHRTDFDHLRTGFPLTGAHATATCESCHVGGLFKGTPTACESCHSRGARVPATAKPVNHVPTTLPCDQCHRSAVTWSGARFSHVTVTPGSCLTCHNNIVAAGKPVNHLPTTSSCDTCHRNVAWSPTRFNHAEVAPGSCASCHNGVAARGKPTNHIVTTASCDACHRTTAWLPATFSHANVAPGTCTSCHGTDKPSGHFVTSRSCDACHTTSAWLPSRYTHSTPDYRTHNSSVTCRNCHTGNTETATWSFAAYKPDCAGCHAGDFKSGPHKKTEVPSTVYYTVAELRNCAGSCHIYTDNTFTTIKTNRNSKHRSTDGDF